MINMNMWVSPGAENKYEHFIKTLKHSHLPMCDVLVGLSQA